MNPGSVLLSGVLMFEHLGWTRRRRRHRARARGDHRRQDRHLRLRPPDGRRHRGQVLRVRLAPSSTASNHRTWISERTTCPWLSPPSTSPSPAPPARSATHSCSASPRASCSGPDQPVVLRLLEIEPAHEGARGRRHGARRLRVPPARATSSPPPTSKTAFDGTSWALLVGSIPRKAGMERGDLLSVNGGIFKPQGRAIAENAASDVRVLVVGNPCNTNCLIARSNAPEVPADRWFAMTRLDQNRAEAQLAPSGPACPWPTSPMSPSGATTRPPSSPTSPTRRSAGKPATEVIDDERLAAGRLHHHGPEARRRHHRGPGLVLGRLGGRRGDRHRGEPAHGHPRRRLLLGGRGQHRPVRRPRGPAVRLPRGGRRQGRLVGGRGLRATTTSPRSASGSRPTNCWPSATTSRSWASSGNTPGTMRA